MVKSVFICQMKPISFWFSETNTYHVIGKIKIIIIIIRKFKHVTDTWLSPPLQVTKKRRRKAQRVSVPPPAWIWNWSFRSLPHNFAQCSTTNFIPYGLWDCSEIRRRRILHWILAVDFLEFSLQLRGRNGGDWSAPVCSVHYLPRLEPWPL